ncbi:hypothetical protein IU501_21385 [Nocardia otitidiscaviarum]|uniref:hypothetical protein n=1 Tax=Nocardia otitidiscaviarum TaxID=1823 RepID=UPI0004A6D770|nr:hypothetical protein [Nocardia otitidiscaviarum]MBF6135544.1 hypothetical protein [Nocardia otitidiscaviarum]MBF6487361.1 hypothetical protein [Nocardia otitidiscaviarum]
MSVLRAYTALTTAPALFVFGPGTATAAPQHPTLGLPVAATSDSAETGTAPATLNELRIGSQTIPLPEGVDPGLREHTQHFLDGTRQQIATAYDDVGFPANEADRRAATAAAGAVIGATIGKIVVFPLEIVGCGVGAAVGAIAGGVVGALPTVGAGAPVGAAVGGLAGCLLGGLAVAIPVDVAGLVGGAVIGGTIGDALGSGTEATHTSAPAVDTPAPQADSPAPQSIATAETFTAISPDTATAITSLDAAIDAMPPLAPDTLGPLTQPANDLLAAVQAAF